MNTKLRKRGVFVCFILFGFSLLCSPQENISGRLKMAYEAHKRGMYSLSNVQIEKYIKENPGAPDIDYARLLYAVNLLYLEEVDKAIESLTLIIKKKPESEFLKDAMSYLVLAYLKKNDLKSALSLYSEYKSRFSPDNFLESQIAQVIFSTATALFKEGNIKQSRELFNLISTDFRSSEYLPEALYYEGLTYYQENNFDRASDLFKSASDLSNMIEHKEIIADIYLKLGDCFFNKKDYTTAEHFFNRVKKEFPDTIYSVWASFQLALIEKRNGNLEKAVSILEGLKGSEEEDIHFRVLSELANVKMLQEKWTESEIYLKEISEFLPAEKNLAEVYLKLGFVNFNMGKLEDSIIYFRKVIDMPASNNVKESAYFWLGYTYYTKNLFDDSMKTWDKLQIDFPESEYIHEILFFTGKRYYESADYPASEKYLSDLTTRFSESPFYQTSMEMLIDSKIQQGKLNEALQLCEDFLEKRKSETISFLYGKTLFLLKDFKKAKDILEKLQSVKPSEKVEATYYLASIYEKRGEIEKAQEKYLEIITFFTNFPDWVKLAEENLKRLKK
ncbi:MAG TPA: tetratricopeptide repeat protein [bacterium]|nr:tetratricopeptide repeat protein [bacterium]HPP30327.1 tetratricopeptide repeat protein [bacterium]